MSWEASTWAVRQRVGSQSEKCLLMIVANRVDKSGVGFPGTKSLAADCCCTSRAVVRNLAKLEAARLLARARRFRRNGSRTTDWLLLAPGLEDRGDMVAPERGEHDPEVLALWDQVTLRPSDVLARPEDVLDATRGRNGGGHTNQSLNPSGELGAGAQTSLAVPEDRVDAFLAFYRSTVEAAQGESLPRFSKAARSAAREILEKHPASSEVAAVLRFGLADHRWYADKILTVPKFRDAYPKLRAKWVGAVAGRAKAEEIRAERGAQEVPAARSVSYDGDRVRIS